MAKTTCNFPDCNREVSTRGLCTKHYFQATKSVTPALRSIAEKYLLASSRGKKRTAAPSLPAMAGDDDLDAEVLAAAAGREIDDGDGPSGGEHDEVRRRIDDVAHAFGAKRIRFRDGNLYIEPRTRTAFFLTDTGRYEKAEIRIGQNKLQIA